MAFVNDYSFVELNLFLIPDLIIPDYYYFCMRYNSKMPNNRYND